MRACAVSANAIGATAAADKHTSKCCSRSCQWWGQCGMVHSRQRWPAQRSSQAHQSSTAPQGQSPEKHTKRVRGQVVVLRCGLHSVCMCATFALPGCCEPQRTRKSSSYKVRRPTNEQTHTRETAFVKHQARQQTCKQQGLTCLWQHQSRCSQPTASRLGHRWLATFQTASRQAVLQPRSEQQQTPQLLPQRIEWHAPWLECNEE